MKNVKKIDNLPYKDYSESIMDSQIHICQSCKTEFPVEQGDAEFYEKIKVPTPTWCPECRMIRRFTWWNYRTLFRRKESGTGKDVFSTFHEDVPFTIFHRDKWFSDAWDPLSYGRDYDFSRPFFEQMKELSRTVPWPSRTTINPKDSDYVNYTVDAKNSYLCFMGPNIENSAYCIIFNTVKEGFDLFESRHSELCYDSYMVDEAYRVFYSVNVEECTDIWFSRNLIGCTNCFGCVNLRNKSYQVFNTQYTKEDYKKFIEKFESGSYEVIAAMKQQAHEFWLQYPMRFTLAINATNSTGEHIEHTNNVHDSYSVHESENLRFSQVIEKATDSYDVTRGGFSASLLYESVLAGYESQDIKFCFEGTLGNNNLEYCLKSHGSSNCFGCVGIQKKEYCILNKQYSKEEYFALREKIIKHMHDMPYTDSKGHVYRYGEFFPTELSPFAYNETIAQDFFPLTKEQAEQRGYLWRESEQKEFSTTKTVSDLPDNIADTPDTIINEVIECGGCKKAYRIIQMELDFYRRMKLPIPRLCPNCRFLARFKFVNPPKLRPETCMCVGTGDQTGIYANNAPHFHGNGNCTSEFQTAYAVGREEILYCEQCYQAEVI